MLQGWRLCGNALEITTRPRRSGPRLLAAGVVGPAAVEPDHAPFHAPGHAEPARILADRIMDRVLQSVRHQRDCAAEPTRDRVRSPGAEPGLAHLLEAHNGEARLPEAGLLLGEARANLGQGRDRVAWRQHAVVARRFEIEVLFE